MAADAGRACLVLGPLAVLGLASAVSPAKRLSCGGRGCGFLLASLTATGDLAAVAPWTVADWVSGRMHLTPQVGKT